MTIGEKLKQLRALKGLSQQEFCEEVNRRHRLDIARKQYSHWEQDRRTVDIKFLKAIVMYYSRWGVTADDLIFDERLPARLKETKRRKTVAI